jgi:hypothetical protein
MTDKSNACTRANLVDILVFITGDCQGRMELAIALIEGIRCDLAVRIDVVAKHQIERSRAWLYQCVISRRQNREPRCKHLYEWRVFRPGGFTVLPEQDEPCGSG